MNTKRKFTVFRRVDDHLTIEAESAEQAIELAKDIPDENFIVDEVDYDVGDADEEDE